MARARNPRATFNAPAFCGCETIRHFDGNAGHPYGVANGSTRPTNVYGLVGEPFCEECQCICEPAILSGRPFVEDATCVCNHATASHYVAYGDALNACWDCDCALFQPKVETPS